MSPGKIHWIWGYCSRTSGFFLLETMLQREVSDSSAYTTFWKMAPIFTEYGLKLWKAFPSTSHGCRGQPPLNPVILVPISGTSYWWPWWSAVLCAFSWNKILWGIFWPHLIFIPACLLLCLFYHLLRQFRHSVWLGVDSFPPDVLIHLSREFIPFPGVLCWVLKSIGQANVPKAINSPSPSCCSPHSPTGICWVVIAST